MEKEDKKKESRVRLWFKFYSEWWLNTLKRIEIKPDERSVLVDLLCLAASNYGEVEIPSRRQIAKQLIISMKLLNKSIDKFIKFGKIDVESHDGNEVLRITDWDEHQADYLKKQLKEGLKHDAGFSDRGKDKDNNIKGKEETEGQESPRPSSTASATSSGSPSEKESSLRGSCPPPTLGHDSLIVAEIIAMLKKCEIQDVIELEGGFGDFARCVVDEHGLDAIDVIREMLVLMHDHPDWIDMPPDGDIGDRLYKGFQDLEGRANRALADSKQDRVKDEFLSLLQSCPGYPFDEYKDTIYFNLAREQYPGVDIVGKAKKKIDYWKKTPPALKGRKLPHEQLTEWFEGDFKNMK